MKIRFYFNIIFLFITYSFHAQNDMVNIILSSEYFEPSDGANAVFEKFQGKETLVLNGRVIVKNQNFSNGIISVDVYANTARSFAGIIFRQQEGSREEVYMRLHKSTQVDALQYTPVFNGETNWQLYNKHQANIEFKTKGWNKLRIEINNKTAVVYVNNENVLTINNLRTDNMNGDIGLFALFNNRFSNFSVTNKDITISQQKEKSTKSDAAIITKWNITKAFLYNEESLNFKNFSKEKYTTVSTESSGLLPISKYVKKPSSGNFEDNIEVYTVASTIINVATKQIKKFSFDYSDKIKIYFNGKLLFYGNNAFRTKGIQHEGHLDINSNTLYLNLKKGKNILHCVVIDRANGWGLMGKL